MLRISLKRIRSAAEVRKCFCQKVSDEHATTSGGEVWDDPWRAAMPKAGFGFCLELMSDSGNSRKRLIGLESNKHLVGNIVCCDENMII